MFSYFYRTQPLFRALLKFLIAAALWVAMQMILYGSITVGIDVIVIGAFLLWYIIKGEVLSDDGYFIDYMTDSYSNMSDEELQKTFEPYGIYLKFEKSDDSGDYPFVPLHLSDDAQQCLINNGIHDLDELLSIDDDKLKSMDINNDHYQEVTAELAQYRKTHKPADSQAVSDSASAENASMQEKDKVFHDPKSDVWQIECNKDTEASKTDAETSENTGKFSLAAPDIRKKFPEQCDDILDYMEEHFHEGDMIESDALCKELSLGVGEARKIMEICIEQELMKEYYGIMCDHCGVYSGNFYSKLLDIPEQVVCKQCGETINDARVHRKLIYKIL